MQKCIFLLLTTSNTSENNFTIIVYSLPGTVPAAVSHGRRAEPREALK